MKSIIAPFQLIENGDMGADIESEIVDVSYMNDVGLQISWDDNVAAKASKIIQDLTYTADTIGAGGNAISITYADPGSASQSIAVNVVSNAITVTLASSAAVAASKIIQDLTYTADSAGVAGNDITVTYVNPRTKGTPLSATLDGTDIVVSLETSLDTKSELVEQDITYIAKEVGVSGNSVSMEYIAPAVADSQLSVSVVGSDISVSLETDGGTEATGTLNLTTDIILTSSTVGVARNTETFETIVDAAADNPTDTVLVDFAGTSAAITCTVTPNDGTNNTANPDAAATGTLDLTADITLTSVAAGTGRNTETLTLVVNAAAANPTDTVLVDFTGTAAAITCTVTPNDGTNNGATPVPLTTAELAELINTGAVVGKTITLTDGSGFRVLQTATGGDATDLANGGEGDGEVATFTGGTNDAVELTTAELVELINTGAVVGKTVTVTDGSGFRTLQTATGGDATDLANGGEGDGVTATFGGGTDSNLVSTASEIASAINASTACSKLLTAYVTGTGSTVQNALAQTSLAGGALSKVISTATEIKTLLDAIAGVAALVNITVSGTGSNVQTTQDETALENGSDYNLTSTADQIKTAVDVDGAAAALVDIVVSGTGATVQELQEETFLEDGKSGAVTGVIAIEGSNDWNEHLQTGTCYALTFDPVLAQPNSNSAGYLVTVDDFSWKYIKVTYERTSGDGILNVSASAKQN